MTGADGSRVGGTCRRPGGPATPGWASYFPIPG